MPVRVEVVPHNPAWRKEFEQEAGVIRVTLGENMAAIHHIGSTAIPTIYAKAVIDSLVEVNEITRVDEQSDAMVALGYESMGELGIPGRRYFRKENTAKIRTHHVHMYEIGSPEIARHLAFRDYMIAHPDAAQEYSNLKRSLAQQLDLYDIESYMDGKDAFIQAMERRAIDWWQTAQGSAR